MELKVRVEFHEGLELRCMEGVIRLIGPHRSMYDGNVIPAHWDTDGDDGPLVFNEFHLKLKLQSGTITIEPTAGMRVDTGRFCGEVIGVDAISVIVAWRNRSPEAVSRSHFNRAVRTGIWAILAPEQLTPRLPPDVDPEARVDEGPLGPHPLQKDIDDLYRRAESAEAERDAAQRRASLQERRAESAEERERQLKARVAELETQLRAKDMGAPGAADGVAAADRADALAAELLRVAEAERHCPLLHTLEVGSGAVALASLGQPITRRERGTELVVTDRGISLRIVDGEGA